MRSQDAMVRYLFAQISLPLRVRLLWRWRDTYALHLMPLPPQFGFVPRNRGGAVRLLSPPSSICERRTKSAPSSSSWGCPTGST